MAPFLAAAWTAVAADGSAQTLSDPIRSRIEGARLGTGYAQIINLSASPDLSAANYTVRGAESDLSLDVFRIPYQAHWFALSPGSDVYWRLSAGYLRMKQFLPTSDAGVDSRWSAASATAGMLATLSLGQGFTLEPALDLGIARLENKSDYLGAAAALRPALDRLLFNWQTDAWIATPSIGLGWRQSEEGRRLTLRAHVARSWIKSFDATDRVQEFSEGANIYSMRAEYARPSGVRVFDRPLDWVVYSSYAGFFGANKDALGFDSVGEIGVGFESPLAAGPWPARQLRVTAGYFGGPGVRGWNIGMTFGY
ncbi:hypothetical protein [Variovorax saccharolyticus]|uniref:hypothetical protein n=1 Tax=Variovorax saccharolyticus TaxID=3053516 RepID=UPI0025753CC7|nr:hypothetical protein [Variovorax sp. J22R187]MDM0019030.1 hypothetical protein [Variovorax sp. J22R187]